MVKTYIFYPKGVCSRKFEITYEDDIVLNINITGGCNGNLQGISKLMQGMKFSDVISKFEGINCGPRPTSCPDQIAKCLKEINK